MMDRVEGSSEKLHYIYIYIFVKVLSDAQRAMADSYRYTYG